MVKQPSVSSFDGNKDFLATKWDLGLPGLQSLVAAIIDQKKNCNY